MPEPKKVPWVTVIIVCAGIGTLCWGFMHPIDVILELKEGMDIRAFLPRAAIPVVVATIAVIGALILFMVRKGVLPASAAEKIIELMGVLYVGYGFLEFFTAGRSCPHDIIYPSASTGSNSVAALQAERRQSPPTDAE